MNRFASIAGCLIWTSTLLAVPVPAEPAPAIPQERLQEWIRDLDSDKFSVRERASKSLLSAGKDAIEALKRAAMGGSSEVMNRSLRILDEMLISADPSLSKSAKVALQQIAESKSPSAGGAEAALGRLRSANLARLQEAGAGLTAEGDHLHRIGLHAVEHPKKILPLLEEFPEIREIYASTKKFGDEEMKALPSLPNLDHIDLFQSGITDESLKEFKRFPKLASIPMGQTKVTDKGLKHLANLTQLEYVGLRGDNITDAGVAHLKKLTNLTGLFLGETKVTDAGLKHLVDMKKMSYLRIHNLSITDKGLEHLKGMKDLQSVELWNTDTTEQGREKLREAIPGVRVLERDSSQ